MVSIKYTKEELCNQLDKLNFWPYLHILWLYTSCFCIIIDLAVLNIIPHGQCLPVFVLYFLGRYETDSVFSMGNIAVGSD